MPPLFLFLILAFITNASTNFGFNILINLEIAVTYVFFTYKTFVHYHLYLLKIDKTMKVTANDINPATTACNKISIPTPIC